MADDKAMQGRELQPVPLSGGYLLVHGSCFSGELWRSPQAASSLSDLDVLWLGRGIKPADEEVAAGLAGGLDLDLRAFSHVGLKTVRSHYAHPHWMTNSWLPSLQHYVRCEPAIGQLLPSACLRFRALTVDEVCEAIDIAWTYAALALASTASCPPSPQAFYAVAKLHLLLAKIEAQRHGLVLGGYADAVSHLAGRAPHLVSGLHWALAQKRGVAAGGEADDWVAAWKSLHSLAIYTFRDLPATVQLRRGLAGHLHAWALGEDSMAGSRVAAELRHRSQSLLPWEASNRTRYEEGFRGWRAHNCHN
jgi:hypothetical protein